MNPAARNVKHIRQPAPALHENGSRSVICEPICALIPSHEICFALAYFLNSADAASTQAQTYVRTGRRNMRVPPPAHPDLRELPRPARVRRAPRVSMPHPTALPVLLPTQTLNNSIPLALRASLRCNAAPREFLRAIYRLRKDNPVPRHAQVLQVQQFIAGHDVESTSPFCQSFSGWSGCRSTSPRSKACGAIPLNRDQVPSTPSHRRPAIQIKGLSKFLHRIGKGKSLAKDRLAFSRLLFLPAKIGRELRRVYVSMILRWYRRLCAHRTFKITSVRSSDRGALCANQSTSRKIMSDNSVAVSALCASMIFRSRSVPKNCPSLFDVSAIPSE